MTYVVTTAVDYEGLRTPDYAGPSEIMARRVAQGLLSHEDARYYTVIILVYDDRGYLIREERP
jgi:hypothetical protein